MNYYPVIIIIVMVFVCETVSGAQGLKKVGNLTIEVKNSYHAGIPGIPLNTYFYGLNDTLELKCRGPEAVYLEWTDERNRISQKSCSKTNEFTLVLEKLGENDNRTIFLCNSTNDYSNITLVLNNGTGSTRKLQDNNVCYKIERVSNCLHNYYYRQYYEIVYRRQNPCPTEMTKDAHNNIIDDNRNTGDNDSIDLLGTDKESAGEDETDTTLLYVGTVVLVFIALAIITFCIYECYKKVKEIKNNDPIYAEPNAVVYAELQLINDNPPNLPDRNDPTYAQIVGILTPAPSE